MRIICLHHPGGNQINYPFALIYFDSFAAMHEADASFKLRSISFAASTWFCGFSREVIDIDLMVKPAHTQTVI